MLLKLSPAIAECYRHAAAGAATDEAKADFLDVERRWLFLPHSYELTERISRFTRK
jgi:hypothetical protein